MADIKDKLYQSFLMPNGFILNTSNKKYGKSWTCYSLDRSAGQGDMWIYRHNNLFAISICDILFHDDLYLEFNASEFEYLVISYYESLSGKEIYPKRRPLTPCIRGYLGRNEDYRALFKKRVPMRWISITTTPEYYEDYLQTHFPEEYENPCNALDSIDGIDDFPQLTFLFEQIRNHHATGISEKLYYEGKVAEAISLIVHKWQTNIRKIGTHRITSQDRENLSFMIKYINEHLEDRLDTNTLAGIARMGRTKLKYTFKTLYDSTPSEYILRERLKRAQYLLTSSDLSVSQISQSVGYQKASNFSNAFRKSTGILPKDFRKMIYPR